MAKTQKIEETKPRLTLMERIQEVEAEIKQIEAEYHIRVGKLQVLKDLALEE